MTEYNGKLMAIGWDTDRVRVIWLQGHKDGYQLPEPLFKAAWKALGEPVEIAINTEGVVQSLKEA